MTTISFGLQGVKQENAQLVITFIYVLNHFSS